MRARTKKPRELLRVGEFGNGRLRAWLQPTRKPVPQGCASISLMACDQPYRCRGQMEGQNIGKRPNPPCTRHKPDLSGALC